MEDAIFWMCFAGVLMILALFPEISYKLTTMFGVMSPANLIFLVMICILFEKVFTLSILVSQLEEKVTILSAEVALRSHGAQEEIKKLQEETVGKDVEPGGKQRRVCRKERTRWGS